MEASHFVALGGAEPTCQCLLLTSAPGGSGALDAGVSQGAWSSCLGYRECFWTFVSAGLTRRKGTRCLGQCKVELAAFGSNA